jgi:hypothetical protein
MENIESISDKQSLLFARKAYLRRLKSLRVRWWVTYLKEVAGHVSAHRVGRIVTPERYRVDGIQHVYRSDWRRYEGGQQCPSPVTLNAAEESFPGSRAVYDLPLWRVLSSSKPSRRGRSVDHLDSLKLVSLRLPQSDSLLYSDPLAALNLLLTYRLRVTGEPTSDMARKLDNLTVKTCLVHAATSQYPELYFELLCLINEWWAGQTPPILSFYPRASFWPCLRIIRTCKPSNSPNFAGATKAIQLKTAWRAMFGRYDVDIMFASSPIQVVGGLKCPEDLKCAVSDRRHHAWALLRLC